MSDLVNRAAIFGGYANGVAVALLITISGLVRSRNFWWHSFIAQFAITLGILLAMLGLMTISATSLEHWLSDTLSLLPLLAGGATWVALAIRRGEVEQAWARLQHLWTIGGYVILHLQCVFSTSLLYGYWVTLGALAAQLCAVELARHRMQHDLWDRSQPARRPQISLGRIFLWMTLLPLIPAYYQALYALMAWLFRQ